MATQLLCNVEIDYSKEPGSVLPFKIELDTDNSVLNPGPSQLQKFCYIVTGVGTGGPTEKDLSHWVLGICGEITEDEINKSSISVVIDGVPQTVVFGDNVTLGLDPTTGCKGLKFDFPLSKTGGVMNVCFELSATYPIGPAPVCLKGGTFSAEGLSICGPSYCSPGKCETYTYQTATVCVPVTVTPTAIPGTTRTICCGDPVINPGALTCPSTARHCHFTVSQKVCIEVPIAFGASAQVGEPRIECETPSGEGCVGCN